MKVLRITGLACIVLGIVLFLVAAYIARQVEDGKGKISKGQTQVNQVREASSWNEYTKGFGNMFANSGQRKIDAGKKEVSKYEKIISGLHIGGTATIALGGVLIIVSFFPRKRR